MEETCQVFYITERVAFMSGSYNEDGFTQEEENGADGTDTANSTEETYGAEDSAYSESTADSADPDLEDTIDLGRSGEGSQEGEVHYGTGDQSTVYTYIPTKPVNEDEIKTSAKKEKKEKKKKEKKSTGGRSLWKKVAVFLLCGVILGGAAAGTFIGVMKVSGYESTLESLASATATTATIASTSTESSSSSSSTAVSTSSVADIAESVMPAIVAVTNTQIYESNDWSSYFFGGSSSTEVTGYGSGVIIGQNDSEILILTNYHVIEDATSLTITFIDESTAEATVKGTAEDNDLAVVAVKISDLSSETISSIAYATLCTDDTTRVGDQVIAIGNALGYGQSVTVGYVSALDREVEVEDGTTLTLIQTDAAINPGNSGGALINMNGEVIGINSAKYSDTDVEGMGFAIPVSEVQDIIDELVNTETKEAVSDEDASYMGIYGVDIDETNASSYNMPVGIYVYQIVEGGPADSSELQERDIITAIDGTEISTMEELKEQLTYYSGGTTVEFTVQRLENGEYVEKTISITLGYASDYTDSTTETTASSENDGSGSGFGSRSTP